MIEKNRIERAVVIGASISGLLAARVLANHFAHVTIVERDVLPPPGQPRKGVPQGRHAHVLLAHGLELLEGFFPGIEREMVSQGALAGDLSEQSIWYSGGEYSPNFRSGLHGIQVSRPLLEGSIVRRLCDLPNMTILENHDAVGLVSELAAGAEGEARVTGLRVADRSAGEPVERVLEADLVVDAAGRGSRSLAWLEALGYARPAEEHIKMNLAYTTREFRRLPEHANGKSPVVTLATLTNHRGGVILAVEGDRWIVTLAGILGKAAPTDLEGFIEFARMLEAPDIYNVIKTAEPLGEGSAYKYPASQRRRFEKLARFPEGILVCGDALCSFNPIYGQGMTTAASEAELLDECLREGVAGIAPRFFRRAARLLDSPWSISAGSDLAFPEVEGKRSRMGSMVGAYLTQLLIASRKDTSLNVAFQRVTNLMDPPQSLFRPGIVWKVIRARLF